MYGKPKQKLTLKEKLIKNNVGYEKIEPILNKRALDRQFNPQEEHKKRIENHKSNHCAFLEIHVKNLDSQKSQNIIGYCLKGDPKFPKHITKDFCMNKECEKEKIQESRIISPPKVIVSPITTVKPI